MELFEKASRDRLRFNTSKGMLSIEDIWSLPLTSESGKVNLYDIGNDLHKNLKDVTDAPFFSTEKKADSGVQMAFDVIRRVIEVRKAEAAALAEDRKRSEKKQQILALLADKEIESLKGKSAEELRAALAAL